MGRRVSVLAVVAAQLGFVVRGYSSDRRQFAFQLFAESSTWRADVVRVTADGRRVPVSQPWAGYRWEDLVEGHHRHGHVLAQAKLQRQVRRRQPPRHGDRLAT